MPKTIAYYESQNDPALRKAMRNQIIYGQITAYDLRFTQFRKSLSRDRVIPDTAADVAVAVMGGVGAATAQQATKTALLGATSAVTGAKGAVDKNLFYDQALSVLFTQMSANRKTVLAEIEKGTALSDVDYPLNRGLIDVAAYRDAGSIPAALSGVATDAGIKKEDSTMAIAVAQNEKLNKPSKAPAAASDLQQLNSAVPQ